MGRPSQLERPAALDALPDGPASVAGTAATAGAPPGSAPLSWRATARAVLPAFVVTRLVTLVAGVVGAALWGIHDASVDYDPAGLTTELGAFGDRLVAPYARWDAVWFLDIANLGYPTSYAPRTAFFPLYPGILRALGLVLQSPVVAGLLVSSACAYVGAMVLHRLTELELGRPAAGMAVWVLFAFPGSLWLSAVYSEGLFLALSVGCVYLAREQRWLGVAAVGLLAAMTRSAGIVLVVPILVMAWQQQAPAGAHPRTAEGARWGAAAEAAGARTLARLRAMTPGLLAAGAVVGGLLLFVVGLWIAGHPLDVSFAQQKAWGRNDVGPFRGVWEAFRAAADGLQQIFGTASTPAVMTPNANWMNPLLAVFLLAGVAALAGAVRRLPPAYAAYAGCALLLPLSAPVMGPGAEPLMSLPRFLGVLFPLAMWAGWWLSRGRWRRTRVVVLGIVGLGLLALFSELTARWLFVA